MKEKNLPRKQKVTPVLQHENYIILRYVMHISGQNIIRGNMCNIVLAEGSCVISYTLIFTTKFFF